MKNEIKSDSIKNDLVNKEISSNLDIINIILQKISGKEHRSINNRFLTNSLLLFKKNYFPKIYSRINFITKTNFKYKNNILNNTNNNILLSLLIQLLLFIEKGNKNFKANNKLFLNKYMMLLNKMYKEKKIDKESILIIIEFIVLLSTYENMDIKDDKNHINKIRKNYNIFKYSIDIVININESEITLEYLKFINNNIIKYKSNKYIIAEHMDLLRLINYSNNQTYIIDYIAKIYSFKYSKSFLDVFMKQIKDSYDIKNKDKSSINIINLLKNDLYLLKMMQEAEIKKYKEDSYILSKGFVINNNSEKISIVVKDINIKEQFSIIFSFCYAPDEDNFSDAKISIVDIIKENATPDEVSGLSFFISNKCLYHRKYNSKDEIKICDIVNNVTYMCYYDILEKGHFSINVKSSKDNKNGSIIIKEPIQLLIKNAKLKLQIGQFFHQSNSNFDGYIGPIIIFNTCLTTEQIRNIFFLKGSYEKVLYFDNFNSKFLYKHDKNINCPFIIEADEINYNNYLAAKNFYENQKNKIIDSLIYDITPIDKYSSLNKKIYDNSIFKEYKIMLGGCPVPQSNSIFFFEHLFTPFEFLKYEGINFLILIFELIISNLDNINIKNIENNKIILLNLFSNLIPYIKNLIFLLKVDYYENEIRHILFALEKCVNKLCIKFKMSNEIGHELNNWIRSLTTQNTIYINNYIKIRNVISKFLLDTKLYNLKDYPSIEIFFITLKNCINLRPEGLMNMEIFHKILQFTVIYKSVTKRKDIRKSRQFKGFKESMNKLLITFFRKCDFIKPYEKLIEILSESMIYNFKKYQLMKIFYLESRYYFIFIPSEKRYVMTWKYFINLFKYLQTHDSFEDITKKQSYILMALCLRIILEYPILGNIFKENKFMNKKKRLSNEIGDEYLQYRDSKANFRLSECSSDKKIRNRYEKIQIKRRPSFNEVKSYNRKNKSLIIDEDEKRNYEKRKSSLDYIRKEDTDISNNFIEFADFFTYNTLIEKLDSSYKLNDYIIRALMLIILESNNNVNITQETKLKFITRIKKFEDLKNKDYSSFLKFSYINREVKTQLINLVKLIEKNADNLTHITYDLFLYLILKTCENKDENKCSFNHLVSSKKICSTIFYLAVNHDKDAYTLIFRYFLDITNYTLPYRKKPFLTDFLYNLLTSKLPNLRNSGKIFANMMLISNFSDEQNNDYVYCMKMNCICLLYRVIKTKDVPSYINEIVISDKGLTELYNNDLIFSKINIFKNVIEINKKKCYAEALFEIILFLYIHLDNDNYYSLLYQIFIKSNNKIKGPNTNSETIIAYLDSIKGQGEKNNNALKFFSKPDSIETPCLCVQFLLKTLKFRYYCENNAIKKQLNSLCLSFYKDAFIMYTKNSSKKKKFKNHDMYNFLYEFIKSDVSKKEQRSIEELISSFDSKYASYLEEKRKKLADKKNGSERKTLSILSFQNFNFFKSEAPEETLNDSFTSCKSSKEVKTSCSNNKKKISSSINKGTNILKKMYKKYSRDDMLDLDNVEEEFISNNYQMNIQQEKIINEIIINDMAKNTNNFFDLQKNQYSLDIIESNNQVILFPKPTLVEQVFAIYFTERLFYNKPFVKMKKFYSYFLKQKFGINYNTKHSFNYPIIMKNYISNNLYFGGLFLKHDFDFFENRYFKISHPYYIDRQKESISKRIFRRISLQNDVDIFLKINKDDKNCIIFYVDLVTNRNVVFGKLIITKFLIFFQNLNREEFLKNKKDDEKIDWLLCSQDCDYSNGSKKLYIFKNEIKEIINRRFLYSFQACEIYLKNGKSYYFNFYSEEKKIEFISLFYNNPEKIKIISDLKTEFKNKGFTKQWLNNKISTLAYLLFINKYSCRSYNDVNQYPVFPWLIIYGDKERDLKYTIAAQDEDSRMKLKELYSFSSEHFPYHYTTHYSNASFLIYYLIRINPFTDNQITLQGNQFDVADRQFNSLDEIQKILFSTSQPREVIPEFFISTEFFYNYNFNYYGLKNNTNIIINDLVNKKGFSSPLEYVLNNEVLLESPKFKSQINFFFDNIFGVGQMGGKENCNIFYKYSYQEMIDLNQKIRKFREQKLSYNEIKNNIARKSNKIISFGQTPFKLFEDKHPQWKEENKNNKSNIEIEGEFFDDKQRFIYFNLDKNKSGKQEFFILLNNNNFLEIKFYAKKIINTKNPKTIKTKRRIKLFSKILLDKEKEKSFVTLYKYNPKFIMINFNLSIFIFGRIRHNSFSIYNKNGDSLNYLMEDIVMSISKSKEYNFFTGLYNGKIFEFRLTNFDHLYTNSGGNINLHELQINLIRSYMAHKDKVSGIYYSELLDLIISSGDDKKIYIRKYYDLSLLSMINIEHKICIDIKINHYHIYSLLYDEIKQNHIVKVFSVNGLVVGKTAYSIINKINFDKNGNLMVGYTSDKKIVVYDPSLVKKIEVIDMTQPVIIKIKKNKNKEIDLNDTFFLDFIYNAENNSIFCYFSNGYLIQKFLDKNNNQSDNNLQ